MLVAGIAGARRRRSFFASPPVYRGRAAAEPAERPLWRAGVGPRPGQAAALAARELRRAILSLAEDARRAPVGPASRVESVPPTAPVGYTGARRGSIDDRYAHLGARPERPGGALRVTLAHDYLLVMRGAERTFAAIADLYPQAPICTLLYDEHATDGRFAGHRVLTSWLQRLGASQANFRRLLPLYPGAAQRLAAPQCDVLISSSSAFAHEFKVPPGAIHVCYCHTPFRYAWFEEERALAEVTPALRPLLRHELARIRRRDVAAGVRVDAYVANSALTAERIMRCYGQESTIIHPPVETHRFHQGNPGEALLVVSEIVRHKRVHVALEAARRARVPIRVVGGGPDRDALAAAYPEAEFVGRVSDTELVELYAQARAVVVPGLEEFGITAVEAQAAGRPVIAAAAGGTLETVIPGVTGELVPLDDVDALAGAMRTLDERTFDPSHARANAERFSVAAFRQQLSEYVSRVAEQRSARGVRSRRRAYARAG